ncbi:MAG: hypothetical protein BWX71_01847 [Deltaproteobacteria bacterium ADurb.Bin072]|nr:MAG: hypothetical protein BWX71_01847 [Deltaproteobacteria bacterium ADurb.Bin072]
MVSKKATVFSMIALDPSSAMRVLYFLGWIRKFMEHSPFLMSYSVFMTRCTLSEQQSRDNDVFPSYMIIL